MIIFPPSVIGGRYRSKAAYFDGTNDWLRRAALAGVANGNQGSISVWIKFNGRDADFQQIFRITASGAERFSVIRNSSPNNRVSFIGRTTGNTQVLGMSSNATIVVASGWTHLLASWQTGGTLQVYVNDVAGVTTSVNTAGDIAYNSNECAVGGRYDGTILCDADIAEFWFNPTRIDFSVTGNRRLFISAAGKPVSLGPDGSRPTGSVPLIYLNGPASSFQTNNGTGGDFTVIGALTDSTTSPSD